MRALRFLPVLCILTLMLAACGESNLDKLNGAWTCDAKSMLDANPAMKAQADQIPGFAEALLGSISVSFDVPKKTMAVSMGKAAQAGPFTVTSDKGDTVVLKMDAGEFNVQLTGKDTITMWTTEDPNTKMFFVRKK